MKRLMIAGILYFCATTALGAERLDASVTTVSGRSVYLNVGRKAGVTVGARVVFRLTDGQQIESTIVDVAANSSRVELSAGALLPAINDRAEVSVEPAAATSTSAPVQPEPKAVPEHPPWSRTDKVADPDAPLLAQMALTRPEDRPTTVRGRVYTMMRYTRDLQNDANYTYLRTGTYLEVKNPGRGGDRLLFDGDADYRSVNTSYSDRSSTNARIQRFSYAWGTDQNAPFRGEVGRFYSQSLPELGVIDGGEAALRMDSGWSFGVGTGLYPLSNNKLTVGDDFGFHAFADYQSESSNSWFQGTIGYQQTWHAGSADRSLLIGRVNARPSRDLMLFGSAMVDLYGSEDSIKGQTADITQLVAQASYTLNTNTGLVGSITRNTWPELKREEYVNLPLELVHNGYVDRFSGSWWRKLNKTLRLSTHAHYWIDQDHKGYGGEVSLDNYQTDANHTSLYGAIYYDDSAYTKGFGARVQGQRDIGSARLFVGYDLYSYNASTLTGGDSTYLRHTFRGDVSWSLARWSWDVEAAYTIGDQEQSVSLGINMQYRY